ncbi:MAG: metalloregulator ArsR/SmtB family transcription factor [Pseudomonadota bacterium]|nr:metalloregulator ArsR/SmtB family transcription factor [Pseudomonadota bacterium]
MDINAAAKCLAELGHPTRLAIYKRLVEAGSQGLPVGALGEELEIPASTLSHHIKGLVMAGLIAQVRDGRTLWCRPHFEHMNDVVSFLTEQCCTRPVQNDMNDCIACPPPKHAKVKAKPKLAKAV